MRSTILATAVFVFTFISSTARAQSFEVGAHFAAAEWSEFESTDLGVGGRFTWKPMPLLGVEADLTFYPSDQLGPFSRNRFESLFGVTVGPKIDRFRPFVKASGGFVDLAGTTGAFACIMIFPPPLACALAGGDTLPAFDIGGGAEVDLSSRTFLRTDISSRFVKYPGPTFDKNGEVRFDGFFGGALRFTAGGGFRF